MQLFHKLRFPALYLAVGIAVFVLTYTLLGLSPNPPQASTDSNSGPQDLDHLWHIIHTRADASQLRNLLETGVNANTVDTDGEPFLSLVLLETNNKDTAYGLVKALLDYGANPNQPNSDGLTPMHRAARRGNEAIITALLDAGGDPALNSNDNITPFDLAINYNRRAVVSLFKRRTTYRPRHLEYSEKRFGLYEAYDQIWDAPHGTLTKQKLKAILKKGVASLVATGAIQQHEQESEFREILEELRKDIDSGRYSTLKHLRGQIQKRGKAID